VFISILDISTCTCHVDPLEEADEWKDEDFDFQTPGFSTKVASPAYSRKIINPLGATPDTVRRLGSQSVDNLKEMFPNGMVYHTCIEIYVYNVHVDLGVAVTTDPLMILYHL
jgi:hypothetical protein